MRRILLFLGSFLAFFICQGQFYYPIQQDAIDFQKRTLLVQLFSHEDFMPKKQLAKHEKGNEVAQLELYKQRAQQQNEMVKAVISKFWKANKSVEFKTKSEIDLLLSDTKVLRQYAVLSMGWFTESQYHNNKENQVDVFAFVAFVAEATDRNYKTLKRAQNQKLDYIFKIAFPTDILNMSDIIFAVQQFNWHISKATAEGQVLERYRTLTYVAPMSKVGFDVIRKKALLLPSEIIDGDTTKGKPSVPYNYSYELKASSFCEEAVEHQFARYVYITMAWSDRLGHFAYFAVNASEGIILAELGHKHKDEQFVTYLNIEEMGKEVMPTYKSRIGLDHHVINQLNHLLSPKQKE